MGATWSIANVLTTLVLVTTAGWIGYRWLQKSDDRGRLITKWIGSGIILYVLIIHVIPVMLAAPLAGVPAAVLLLLILGATWAGDISRFAAGFLTDAIDGGTEELEPRPCYSAAETKRTRGLYREAIEEIRKQLEKFPTDAPGQIMLAQIQAEHLNDLEAAANTLERLLQQKGHSNSEICGALHQLADWHLRFGIDPDSAKAALERVTELFPETHQAQVAAERIAHLPSLDYLSQSQHRPGIVLKQFERNIGIATQSPLKPKAEADPAVTAAEYVRQLEKHPMDSEAREKLAMIYAEHFQRPDLAIEQLNHLLALPAPSQKNVTHWLNLVADIQVKHQNDPEAARHTLQQIIVRFPNSAVAQNAATRLAYLGLETRRRQASQTIKLGSYEKDLGLKKRP